MKKFGCRLLCCFIPSRRVRQLVRNKILNKPKDTIDWNKNHIWLIAPDGTRRSVRGIPNCEFKVSGENNNVYLFEPIRNNLRLIVDVRSNVNISVGANCAGTFCVHRNPFQDEELSNITIGKDCSATRPMNIKIPEGGGGRCDNWHGMHV